MSFLHRLLAFGAIAALLTSCGRGTYSFSSQLPLEVGAEHSRPKPQVLRPVGIDSAATIVLTATSVRGATSPQTAQADATTAARLRSTPPTAARISKLTKTEANTLARPLHASLVQKVVLKRMATQLHKLQAARQNVAQIEKVQAFSKAGRAAIIALVGAVLVAIVVGASANSVENATGLILLGIIGYALLVTGIVLLVISLVNGG